MKYLLLHKCNFKFKVLSVADDKVSEAKNLFRRRGLKVQEVNPPPSADELCSWSKTNVALATDGCTVHGLCSCKHSHHSWLAVEKDMENE